MAEHEGWLVSGTANAGSYCDGFVLELADWDVLDDDEVWVDAREVEDGSLGGV